MQFRIEKGGAKGQNKGRREAHLRVSVGGLFGLGALLVLGLVWVFILGVLVGRGYQPEETVPELARIMPSAAEKNATAAAPEEGVLQPEELQFYDSLKSSPQKAETAPEPAPKPKPAPKKVEDAAAPAAAPEEDSAPSQETVQAAQPKPDTAAAGPRFRYVYQTASFRKYEMARAFQDQIEALGIATAVEEVIVKGDTWRRVNAYFTGTPSETEQFKERLKTLGVDRVILRSKTPL